MKDLRLWRECDSSIYCRVNLANALIAQRAHGTRGEHDAYGKKSFNIADACAQTRTRFQFQIRTK
jgi:hypothetical protein